MKSLRLTTAPGRKNMLYLLHGMVAILLLLPPASTSARAPFGAADLRSTFINEFFRDDGLTRQVACQTGAFNDPGSNAEAVWQFFSDKLPAHQIAGIIGNMTAESGVYPQQRFGNPIGEITPASALTISNLTKTGSGAINLSNPDDPNSGTAWGIVQFHPPGKFVNNKDYVDVISDANVLHNQLIYLWDQLQGAGSAASEKAAGDDLKSTGSVADATESFAAKYERFTTGNVRADPSWDKRLKAANGAMARFSDKIPTVASPVSGTTVETAVGSCTEAAETGSVVAVAQEQALKGGSNFIAEVEDGNYADFVSWTFKQAGTPFTGGAPEDWQISSAVDIQEFFKNTAGYQYILASQEQPQPGDVAFFIAPANGIEHAAIVVSVGDGVMAIISVKNGSVTQTNDVSTEPGVGGLDGYGRRPAPAGGGSGTGGGAPPPNIPGGCIVDGYINPKLGECVGVPTGTVLSAYNSNTNTSADVIIGGGQTIDGKIIYGCIDVVGANVTIKNSRIICSKGRDLAYHAGKCAEWSGCGLYYDGAINSRSSGLVLENNDILCGEGVNASLHPAKAPCDYLVNGGNYTARRNNMYNMVDGFFPTSSVTIEYNYIHGQVEVLEEWIPLKYTRNGTNRYSHADGVQTEFATSNVIIRGNFFQGNSDNGGASGLQAILTKDATNLTIDSNRLDGYFKSLRIAALGGSGSITNNVIDSIYKSHGWVIQARGSYNVSGNKFDDAGGSPVTDANIKRN